MPGPLDSMAKKVRSLAASVTSSVLPHARPGRGRAFFWSPRACLSSKQPLLLLSKRPHTAQFSLRSRCQAGYGPYRAAAYVSARSHAMIMAVALSTQCQAPNPPLSGEAAAGALRHSEHSHLQSNLKVRSGQVYYSAEV
jgi:hypothetical protein